MKNIRNENRVDFSLENRSILKKNEILSHKFEVFGQILLNFEKNRINYGGFSQNLLTNIQKIYNITSMRFCICVERERCQVTSRSPKLL